MWNHNGRRGLNPSDRREDLALSKSQLREAPKQSLTDPPCPNLDTDLILSEACAYKSEVPRFWVWRRSAFQGGPLLGIASSRLWKRPRWVWFLSDRRHLKTAEKNNKATQARKKMPSNDKGHRAKIKHFRNPTPERDSKSIIGRFCYPFNASTFPGYIDQIKREAVNDYNI